MGDVLQFPEISYDRDGRQIREPVKPEPVKRETEKREPPKHLPAPWEDDGAA